MVENDYLKIVKHVEKREKVKNLMTLVNKESLELKHKLPPKKKATGVDRITKSEYEKNLDENLNNLVAKMKTFSYKPLPVRRTHIPKIGSDKLRSCIQ